MKKKKSNHSGLPQKYTADSEFILFVTEDEVSRIQVRLQENTVWLSQKLISELYQVSVPTVNEHIKNIYSDNEINPNQTIRKFRIVQREGKKEVTRLVDFYNLEMIIAVGYRVRSHRGTQFRRWATERLNEYLVKGFVLDDDRLKEGKHLGTDYFDELLERIRDIRASEKLFYQKVRDIYKLSIDYDSKADTTIEFFQIVQNKLHWAITGKTAAELISERADASKPHMGLTSWKGARVRKGDVTVAKNYLNAEEIGQLNRIIVMYLDYAEDQAKRSHPLYMAEWKRKLDSFLQFNEREILDSPGKVSAEIAKELALKEYEKFHRRQLAEEAQAPDPDFDDVAKRLEDRLKKKE